MPQHALVPASKSGSDPEVFVSAGSEPRMRSRGLCALVLSQGLHREGGRRPAGKQGGDGRAECQNEDPWKHVGGGVGDCQGHAGTPPEKVVR